MLPNKTSTEIKRYTNLPLIMNEWGSWWKSLCGVRVSRGDDSAIHGCRRRAEDAPFAFIGVVE